MRRTSGDLREKSVHVNGDLRYTSIGKVMVFYGKAQNKY